MEQQYVSVYALNRYLKAKLDSDTQLQHVYIKGEISNYKPHPSGHLYFTLKDEKSRINAVMFARSANRLDFILENGMKVLIEARVSVYEVTGAYQLYVENIILDGIGALFLKYEQLKEQLSKEGIFDPKFKKRIPTFPSSIAVLSAKSGDGLQDIIKTLKNRFPCCQVVVFPIPVQGRDAYIEIIKQLKFVDTLKFSTIILARGGGSLEDLFNFNEEQLVRCVFSLNTPIITGVGHETDTTLCDYVADQRASTPTGAAVIATPNIKELYSDLVNKRVYLKNLCDNNIMSERTQLMSLTHHYLFVNPHSLYQNEFIKLSSRIDKLIQINHLFSQKNHTLLIRKNDMMSQLVLKRIDKYKNDYLIKINTLQNLNPLNVLSRGYGIVYNDDRVIDSITKVKKNDMIKVVLQDGHFTAKVE